MDRLLVQKLTQYPWCGKAAKLVSIWHLKLLRVYVETEETLDSWIYMQIS